MAVGVNVNKNDPCSVGEATRNWSVHAEVAALKACRGSDLRNAVLYVARLSRKGGPAMSKPCENCQKALRKAGIKKVIYTLDSSLVL